MEVASITEFRGAYRFLSNFWFCAIDMDGSTYPSVEHAYQAAKTFDFQQRGHIRRSSTPGGAKALGRKITLRLDWDAIKIETMRALVRQKFSAHTDLRAKLLATGDAELIEGNHWGDTFWGQCPIGNGQNWLGKILMEVRAELSAA